MPKSAIPFLMFQGRAEEAVNFYVSVFSGAHVEEMLRFGPEGPGKDGSLMRGRFTIAGQEFLCFDSYVQHQFGFTPAISIFTACESEAELDAVFASLSDGGQVLMPPDNYGFSTKFAWVSDRFGVSWQLNLE